MDPCRPPTGADHIPGVRGLSQPPPGVGPGQRRWLTYAIVGYVVGLFVAVLAEGAWVSAHGNNTNSLGAVVAGTVGLWVGFVGSAAWATAGAGSESLIRDFGLRFRPVDVVIGAVAGVGSQYGLDYLVYLPFQSNRRLIHEVGQPAEHLAGLAHGGGVVLLVAVVVVGAPIAEELFFRGLLLRAISARIGNVWAVGISAVAFGLAHYEALQLPVLVLFGAILGLLVVRTGRLGPSICAHAAFNAVAVYSLIANR